MLHIYNLPHPILFLIRDFIFNPFANLSLVHDTDGFEYEKGNANPMRSAFRYSSPLSWRNFLNTNKEFFEEIKKLSMYYDFKETVCAQLFRVVNFDRPAASIFDPTYPNPINRSKIQQKLTTGSIPTISTGLFNPTVTNVSASDISTINPQQSDFVLNLYIKPSTGFGNPNYNHGLWFENLDIPFLFDRLTVNITEETNKLFGKNPEISLKTLSFIKHLTLWNQDPNIHPSNILKIRFPSSLRLTSFSTNMRYEFIPIEEEEEEEGGGVHSPIENVKVLAGPSEQDWTKFKLIESLNIRNSSIRDASPLRHIHTLNLSKCEQLEDVSMLGNVYSLNIDNCSRILSIHSLGNVKKLSIQGLTQLKDGLPPNNEVKDLIVDSNTFQTAGVIHFLKKNKKISIFPAPSKSIFASAVVPVYSLVPFQKVFLFGFNCQQQQNFLLNHIEDLVGLYLVILKGEHAVYYTESYWTIERTYELVIIVFEN
eukprot:gene8493-9189_t